jgi:hypothetical protein
MTGTPRVLVFDTANAEGMAFIVERFGYSAKHVSTMHELADRGYNVQI